jgi:hypothetical protein
MNRGTASFVVLSLTAILTACGGLIRDDENVGDTNDVAIDASVSDAAPPNEGGSTTTSNDWSCLGHVASQSPVKTSLSWQVQPTNVASGDGFADTLVWACASDDSICSPPVASTYTNSAFPFTATLGVPTGANGFDGFWQTQPPGDLLNLYFNNVPIIDDVQIDDRQTWGAGIFNVVLGSVGASWDETKGVVGFQIHDCNSRYLHQSQSLSDDGADAAGVSLSIDPPSAGIILGYFDGDTVSTTQGHTDSSGEGGFLNVPEGWVTITATLAATNQNVGSARVYSKAGAISSAIISPQ